jgi:predicted transcriptional regulator
VGKVTVTAFIEEDLKERLKALADRQRRSVSQMISLLIEEALANEEANNSPS